MEIEARRIRTAVQRQQELRTGTTIRYPEQLRRQALAYASRRRAAGHSLKSIVRGPGLRAQLHFSLQNEASRNKLLPRVIDHVARATDQSEGRSQIGQV